MPVWYDNWKNGNVELGNAWQPQAGGFHIFRGPSGYMGKDINWLRGDNVASAAGAKRISHVIPQSDLAVSMEWRFLFQLSNTANRMRFMPFWNGPDPDFTAVGTQGYFVEIRDTNTLNLWRADGNSVVALVIGGAWVEDTDEHLLVLSREVSGANRFWRLTLDSVLLGGPTTEATYTAGTYYGFNMDERDAVAEIYIQS